MKKLAIIFICLVAYFFSAAQTSPAGNWQGKLKVGGGITLIFHIQSEAGNYTVGIDCPEQGIKDLKAGPVTVSGDSVIIEVSSIRGAYRGKMTDDSTMEGNWVQGLPFPLQLKKINSIPELRRPQTPVGPFPYISQDLIYYNHDSSIRFGATITIPKGKGPFPAILLITGSGQQNRDEEILGHKPFAVIADHLTRNGFIVLRVDDRGMGETTGQLEHATSRDFADDALVSLAQLKKRKDVDKKKIGLLGHSEGGMIAEMLAGKQKDISYMILLAAPGEKITRLMTEQNEALLKTAGLPPDAIHAYLDLYGSLIRAIMENNSAQAAQNMAAAALDEWVAKTDAPTVAATTGIKDEASKKAFLQAFMAQAGSDWFRYFISFDPAPFLQKTRARVLALNGERDIQVLPDANLAGIETSLKKSSSPSYSVKEMKGLNHLFQKCNRCTIQEYGQLEQTIAPEVLDEITGWLNREVKNK